MKNRVLALQGVHNFRDYGGYAARGGRLREGRLWRSGQHAAATIEDLARIHKLGIGTVIDLRGDSERSLFPCLRHEAFDADVLYHTGETAGSGGRAVHEEMAESVKSREDAIRVMVDLYATLPFRPVLVRTLQLYLQALSNRDTPSLLHCLAGKDRTGLAAALLHSLMGVHEDDIISDYMLTNSAGDSSARADALRRNFAGSGMPDAAMQVLISVEPGFLAASFEAIRAKHGTVAAYAERELNAGPAVISAIEARLVA
jgi:protein tyrosine/serine phosphatase